MWIFVHLLNFPALSLYNKFSISLQPRQLCNALKRDDQSREAWEDPHKEDSIL